VKMVERARIKVGGIMTRPGLCLVGVMAAPDRPGLASSIFRALGEASLNVQFIVQSIDLTNLSHVLFCVAREDSDRVLAALHPLAVTLGAGAVSPSTYVALVSVYGPDFRERPALAGTAFGALGDVGINILAISTSISTISCVIAEEDLDAAVRALHGVFDLP
jgi:aspartate kinase